MLAVSERGLTEIQQHAPNSNLPYRQVRFFHSSLRTFSSSASWSRKALDSQGIIAARSARFDKGKGIGSTFNSASLGGSGDAMDVLVIRLLKRTLELGEGLTATIEHVSFDQALPSEDFWGEPDKYWGPVEGWKSWVVVDTVLEMSEQKVST